MVERIRTLLEVRQLTPTQFADAIGIARPIVSHILSGRNKPSLEVVQRILGAMPDLSMPWLLNGTGPMQATAAASVPVEQPSAPLPRATAAVVSPPVLEPQPVTSPAAEVPRVRSGATPPKFAPTAAKPPVARPALKRFSPASPKPTPAPAATPPPAAAPLLAATGSDAPAPILNGAAAPVPQPQAMANSVAAESSAEAVASMMGTEKPIRRIVIFYRDGSFADFQPE